MSIKKNDCGESNPYGIIIKNIMSMGIRCKEQLHDLGTTENARTYKEEIKRKRRKGGS